MNFIDSVLEKIRASKQKYFTIDQIVKLCGFGVGFDRRAVDMAVNELVKRFNAKDTLNYDHLESLSYEDYEAAIHNEFNNIIAILRHFASSGIVSAEEFNVEHLLAVYDLLMSLEGTTNTKEAIFNRIIDRLPKFSDEPITIPTGIDWDQEVVAIRGIIASLSYFADAEGNIKVDEIEDLISTSYDAKALEAMLQALNRSQIYRSQLYEAITEKLNHINDGDFDLTDSITDWFKDQEVNGLVSISEWDAEITILAKLIAVVNYLDTEDFGLSSFNDVKLGVMDGQNVAEISTEDFEVYNYGLRQILQLLGASKSFDLAILNTLIKDALVDSSANQSGNGVIKTQKTMNELTNDEWISEIDNFITLLDSIQASGLLNSSTGHENDSIGEKLHSLSVDELESFIINFNHVLAIREFLPDVIADAMDGAGAATYKSGWLLAQIGVDGFGNNNPTASITEWDNEAHQLAIIINESNNISLDDLTLSELTDEELNSLETMLTAINNAQSLDINAITPLINDLLVSKGYSTIVLGVKDKNSNGSDQDEWAAEIPTLIQIISDLRNVSSLSATSLNSESAEIGAILEVMKGSNLFGNDVRGDGTATTDDDIFNSLIIDVLDQSELLSNSENPHGFIDESTANTTDWAQYDYVTELQILSAYDTTKDPNEQSDGVVKQLSESQIVHDFFDIATIINDKLDGVSTTIYSETLVLANYINNGQPVTNDLMATKDWASEIDDANEIIRIFEEASTDSAAFKADLEALANSGTSTLASDAATELKADLESRGIWNML